MSFIRNNEYHILLFVIVGALVIGSVGLGISLRGGHPAAITSFHSLVLALHHK